jgi:hypothetical protein
MLPISSFVTFETNSSLLLASQVESSLPNFSFDIVRSHNYPLFSDTILS